MKSCGSDEPPPLLGSWRRIYAAVVLYLGMLIGLMYAFTKIFAP